MQYPGAKAQADGGVVVIPCLNEKNYIGEVIGNVLRDPALHKLLIVVADGGSTDGTAEIVSRIALDSSNFVLMANPKRIQSAGINLAARRFGEGRRWLIRMDAHARYPEAFASQMIAEAERTGVTSVVVAMKSVGTECFQRAVAAAQNSVLGSGGASHHGDGAEGYVDHGHHALIQMDSFFAIGGYDENQAYNEDAELDCRLARAGGKIWLTRAARVAYYPRTRAGDLFHQYRNHGYGRATTSLRHRNRLKLRQLLPAAVLPSAVLTLASPWIPEGAAPCILWMLVCLLFGFYLGLRERSFCVLASGCAAMIMHMAWSIGFWSAIANAGMRLTPKLPLFPERAR